MSDFADHAAEAPELGSALERARHMTLVVERERIAHELNYRPDVHLLPRCRYRCTPTCAASGVARGKRVHADFRVT
jgi:hypothetical protein